MEPLGKYLKEERELQNLSLEEVAEFTKIRKQFLNAIEEDSYELLPPAIYVKGYLTAYARYLGINPNEVVLRYQKYLEELTISEERSLKPLKLEPHKQISFPSKREALYLLLAILFTITLFATFFIRNLPQISFHDVLSQKELMPPPIPSIQIQEERKSQIEMSEPNKVKAENNVTSDTPIFKVMEADLGTVIKREGNHLTLEGKSREFICNNQIIYFLTKIKTNEELKIVHVWMWRGKEYHRNEIDVKASEWSVYSYITLRSHQFGDWKVEARVGDKVLASLSFNVTGYKEYLFAI